jgi:hypothetical protein
VVDFGLCKSTDTDLRQSGFFGKGEMQKEFEESSFKLQPGSMSGVVETASGLHLIERYVVVESVEYLTIMLTLQQDCLIFGFFNPFAKDNAKKAW